MMLRVFETKQAEKCVSVNKNSEQTKTRHQVRVVLSCRFMVQQPQGGNRTRKLLAISVISVSSFCVHFPPSWVHPVLVYCSSFLLFWAAFWFMMLSTRVCVIHLL